MAKSRKFRNVAANGQVAFVVDDLASVQPWRPRFLEIRGHAEAIAGPTDSAYGAGAPMGFDGAIIRIHPERLISFGVDDPDREVQSLAISKRDFDCDRQPLGLVDALVVAGEVHDRVFGNLSGRAPRRRPDLASHILCDIFAASEVGPGFPRRSAPVRPRNGRSGRGDAAARSYERGGAHFADLP